MYKKYIKNILDFLLAFIGLIILFPFFIIFSILIKLESKGPVFFKQERIGKDGRVFKIYKFRSMIVGAENIGTGVYSKRDDNRVTRVGKFIRMTSIDELPQLINILKGEMSIIGPRPVLTYHPWKYEEYTEHQLKRFKVKPGVTGWAQINGRKDVEWNKRIDLDIYYVENINFLFDLKIFFKTIYNIVMMKDNYNVKQTAISNNIKEEKTQDDKIDVHN